MSANIKQPEPAIITSAASNNTQTANSLNSSSAAKRKYNTPYVGVLEAPNLSTTPVMDAFCKTKEENPHKVYKIASKKYKLITPQTIASLGVLICAALSTKSLFKK